MVAWAALPTMSNGVAASRRRRRGAGVDLQPSSSLNRQEARGTTEEEEEEEAASAVAEEGWRIQVRPTCWPLELLFRLSMISRSATQKRAVCQPAAVTKFRNFDDVEIRDVNQPKSIFARVDFKFPVSASGNLQRFILLDMTGSKIEAVARGTVVS
ncbi:hypothetical protein EJB05_45095 [Eragrostis curvula]|uniref:Uncharacterized protein n=1 Tax=Eragrostis curvula TaxID=38414 RepID=A0A5J9TJK9_9POAL|nr:hypothetical protein EJB05_45095 [Eragrostis curvula]